VPGDTPEGRKLRARPKGRVRKRSPLELLPEGREGTNWDSFYPGTIGITGKFLEGAHLILAGKQPLVERKIFQNKKRKLT